MKKKILIVEDTIADVVFLKGVLEKENYEVTYEETGEKALSMLQTETPDLVILDILLPDIDGFEVCKRIRKNDRFISIPVLFYSVIKTVDEKLLGLEMGASDFLPKSADVRELLSRIRNLLVTKTKIDELIDQSLFDPTTHTYNRKYFQTRLYNEYLRSKRFERNLSCAIVDVDNFKTVNQSFGYYTGDQVLKTVAEFIRENIRGADELCRYGGDEFGILFPETDLHGAYAAIERVRQYLMTSDAGQEKCPVRLTVSCGVTACNPQIEDIEELITQANKALHMAKEEGRNQTKAFTPLLGKEFFG